MKRTSGADRTDSDGCVKEKWLVKHTDRLQRANFRTCHRAAASTASLPQAQAPLAFADLCGRLHVTLSKMVPGKEVIVELHCREKNFIVTADEQHIEVLSMASRPSCESDHLRDRVDLLGMHLRLAFSFIFLAFSFIFIASAFITAHNREILELTNAWNKAAEMAGKGTMSEVPGRKYNADHAPVMSHPVQSQLHHDVVRVLRTAQYKAFAAMLDNMTESVVRQGVTVFAPSDEALSDFQKKNTGDLRLEDVVRFHVVTNIMPYSNLLRMEVGSRLTTDVSNIKILVTNVTAGSYQVDDAVIVDPDLYTDATIAVHGINAVFNTTKIFEEELEEPVNGGGIPQEGLPQPLHSRAFKNPNIAVIGIPVCQILVSFAGLFLIYLAADDV